MTITEIEYNGRQVEVLHDLNEKYVYDEDMDAVTEYRGVWGVREIGGSEFDVKFVNHEVLKLVSRKLMENY